MNITQGNIFWEKGMDIKYNYPYITKDRKCDVLVIGGGISGALSAYYQAKQGYNVIIVEKNLIGYNSTLENVGVLIGKVENDSVNKKKSKRELDKLNALQQEAIQDITEIIAEINSGKEEKEKLEYTLCNLISYSEKATGRFALSRQYDEEIANKVPVQYVEENTVLDISGAIEYKDRALILNPYIFNQELINMLDQMENVEVYENTFVESINSKDSEVEALTSNRFKIHAKKVILATGVAMIKYLKEEELELYKTHNIVAKIPENINIEPFVAIDEINNKFVRITNNHVILNGEDIKVTSKEAKDEYEARFAKGKYKKLYNNLLKLLNTDNIKIKNCFYGMYIMTKDRLPIIDEIEEMPNVYCNLGVGKNGIIHNLIGAKMLKNIYSDCYTKDMYMFRISK